MLVKKITNNKIQIDAPAKINLFLEVLNKREDGFHNINSLFQAISIYDRLLFELIEEPVCQLKVLGDNILPVDSTNLIVRTYNYIKEKFELTGGLKIQLEKKIPIAAGLGGGSSDAAATINACNYLFNLELTDEAMAQIGLQIGSDLPFFFSSGQAIVTGQGEIIEDVNYPVNYQLLVVQPPLSISTAQSYSALKRGLTKSKNAFKLGTCRTVDSYINELQEAGNDFEEVHLVSFPEIGRIKDGLLRAGAVLARMSGSGPCVFGVFLNNPDRKCITEINRVDGHVFTAEPVTLVRCSFN